MSWPASDNAKHGVSLDGSKLSFTNENECVFIRTLQDIPIEDEKFRFETRISDGGGEFAIGIGFTSKLPEIGSGFPQQIDSNTMGLCMNNGSLCHGNNYTEAFDKNSCSDGDVVTCHLQRVKGDDINYSVGQFFRNGVSVGIVSVPETKLYPCVWVASGDVVLETNLGDKRFVYKKGIITL